MYFQVLPIQSNIIIPASVVLTTTQKKKIKPKKSRKQKEKKAPYSILASNELGEEEDAKEKESQISEGDDIDKGDEGRERSIWQNGDEISSNRHVTDFTHNLFSSLIFGIHIPSTRVLVYFESDKQNSPSSIRSFSVIFFILLYTF